MARKSKARSFVWIVASAAVLMLGASGAFAAEEAEAEAAPAAKPPPLPLHTIEGVGGLVLTPTALLVNPGPPGTVIGKPAVSLQFGMVGDKDLEAAAITWTLWQRVELGYAFNRLGLDDFENDLQKLIPGADVGTHDVQLHHFNVRVNLIQEGQGGHDWVPAITAGAHYKYNADIDDMDSRLGGALTGIGLDDNDGVDFTLTATKIVKLLKRPTILSVGARATEAAQFGFLGFTNDYDLTFEGSAVMLVTDRLAVGAEYRQKPDELGRIPGVIGGEDDWWDVHAAYIVNDHMNIYATVGHAGTVLNHKDEIFYAAVLKYEF
ncbi:MAG: DUF3034 family protein [Planctomycetota bacterium]|jgi:hypothetical protein